MKALIATLALLISVSAQAHSLKPGFSLNLPKVIENGQKVDLAARATVDLADNKITIELYNDPCGQIGAKASGAITCMAMPHLVSVHTVAISDVSTTCGSVYYSGTDDQTPVDGLKVDITVADHSKRVCMDVVAQYSGAEMRVEAVRTQTVNVYKMLHANGF